MSALTHPQILFACDLREGDVVFLGAKGWERDARRARVARDSDEAAALEAIGKSEIDRNVVVDVYLAEVEVGPDGAPAPLHYREKMRLKGPSVRKDLGKQARLADSGDAA
jgi:sulfite reductase (NADPH) hemoprotein beta-component